jgi:hypothetical protein
MILLRPSAGLWGETILPRSGRINFNPCPVDPENPACFRQRWTVREPDANSYFS